MRTLTLQVTEATFDFDDQDFTVEEQQEVINSVVGNVFEVEVDDDDDVKAIDDETKNDEEEGRLEEDDQEEAAEEEKEKTKRDRKAREEASLREREKEVQRALAPHLRDRDKERIAHQHGEAVLHFTALLTDLVIQLPFALPFNLINVCFHSIADPQS